MVGLISAKIFFYVMQFVVKLTTWIDWLIHYSAISALKAMLH